MSNLFIRINPRLAAVSRCWLTSATTQVTQSPEPSAGAMVPSTCDLSRWPTLGHPSADVLLHLYAEKSGHEPQATVKAIAFPSDLKQRWFEPGSSGVLIRQKQVCLVRREHCATRRAAQDSLISKCLAQPWCSKPHTPFALMASHDWGNWSLMDLTQPSLGSYHAEDIERPIRQG